MIGHILDYRKCVMALVHSNDLSSKYSKLHQSFHSVDCLSEVDSLLRAAPNSYELPRLIATSTFYEKHLTVDKCVQTELNKNVDQNLF